MVVQHANVGTITENIIDNCIHEMIKNNKYSSVVPVHEKSEYNPYRAKKISKDGVLLPFIEEDNVSANRQDLPKSYFFDHSIWILRNSSIKQKNNGQAPWGCMGNNIKPYITSGCLDVHSIDDLKYTEKWITDNKIPIPKLENEMSVSISRSIINLVDENLEKLFLLRDDVKKKRMEVLLVKLIFFFKI